MIKMSSGDECNIKVVCRVRPLNSIEEANNSRFVLKFPSEDTITCGGKSFSFDKVFKPQDSQEIVYTKAAKCIVSDVLNGYNGTIFAYGQTSSGKTHTMEGVIGESDLEGIIPRIVDDIFNFIYEMEEVVDINIKASYFEIYMDKIQDLLEPMNKNLSVHEDKNRVPYVKDISVRGCGSNADVMEIISTGKANRHVTVTNMNEHSSRSHSVFQLKVEQENPKTNKKLSGNLYLVDLAGSEKVAKTGAEGSVLDEAKNINKSLSALGNVISALAEGNKSHVPYRDSKLTRILQQSLGGNARTTMIICCSPASYNESETKSTLQFGQRAKTIKNTVVVNEELTAEEWKRRYEKERDKNNKLKKIMDKYLEELQRWRNGECVPSDEQASTTAFLGADASTPSEPYVDHMALVAPGGLSGASNEELSVLQAEKLNLYQQLDDKDDEIKNQTQQIESLKDQLYEQEDIMENTKRDFENLQLEMQRMQAENESAKEEVKEVLNALEELAINYDQKNNELERKSQQLDAIVEELDKSKNGLATMDIELKQLKDVNSHNRSRTLDMMSQFLKEISEMANLVYTENVVAPTFTSIDKIEEEFAHTRLFLNRLKTEIKNVANRCSQMEQQQVELTKCLEDREKELSNNRLIVQQHEAKVKSVSELQRETEQKKRQLENELDNLKDEFQQLSTQQELLAQKEQERSMTADEMKQALEKRLSEHHEHHTKQLGNLRTEISEKEGQLAEVKDQFQKLQLVHNQLEEELIKSKSDNVEKTQKLANLTQQMDRQDQAKADLKGLEETVAIELQKLHNLRKLLVADLQNRVKKSSKLNMDDEESVGDAGSAVVQKQKITFLETNLEQLTKVHKQLVRDNADLRCELPKLEKRLRATMERVKSLESALKEAKEGAMKDRKRYQHEVDRIKEAVRQKNLQRRGHMPTISKPIRTGQNLNQSGVAATRILRQQTSHSNN